MFGAPGVDRFLHLALFVAGAAALAVGVLAILERVTESGGHAPTVRWVHIAVPAAAFAILGIAERLYHAWF